MTEYLVEKYGNRLATTSIEVKVTDSNGRYFLPDNAILRRREIVGLLILSNPNDNIKTPQSKSTLVSDAVVLASFVTFKNVNDGVIYQHHLSDFQTAGQAGDVRLLSLPNGFNPQSSYIELPADTLITVGEAYLLQFVYVS